jgi:hypothetical protein
VSRWRHLHARNWVEPTTAALPPPPDDHWSLAAVEQFLSALASRRVGPAIVPRHALKVLLALIVWWNQMRQLPASPVRCSGRGSGFGHDDAEDPSRATFNADLPRRPARAPARRPALVPARPAPALGRRRRGSRRSGPSRFASLDGDLSGGPRLARHLLMTVLLARVVCRGGGGGGGVRSRGGPLCRRSAPVSYGMYLLHRSALDAGCASTATSARWGWSGALRRRAPRCRWRRALLMYRFLRAGRSSPFKSALRLVTRKGWVRPRRARAPGTDAPIPLEELPSVATSRPRACRPRRARSARFAAARRVWLLVRDRTASAPRAAPRSRLPHAAAVADRGRLT